MLYAVKATVYRTYSLHFPTVFHFAIDNNDDFCYANGDVRMVVNELKDALYHQSGRLMCRKM